MQFVCWGTSGSSGDIERHLERFRDFDGKLVAKSRDYVGPNKSFGRAKCWLREISAVELPTKKSVQKRRVSENSRQPQLSSTNFMARFGHVRPLKRQAQRIPTINHRTMKRSHFRISL
jgi:hypothetical protein